MHQFGIGAAVGAAPRRGTDRIIAFQSAYAVQFLIDRIVAYATTWEVRWAVPLNRTLPRLFQAISADQD
jgi:hypothetical protein